MNKKNIMIVEGLNRQGFSVAKALKMAGDYGIHFASSPRGITSKIRKVLNYDLVDSYHCIHADACGPLYAEQLVRIIQHKNIDAVLPVTMSIVPVSMLKPLLKEHCKVLIEDYDKLIRFHDKPLTLEMAKLLDIPYPLTVFPKTIEDVNEFGKEADYPVVIKARKGTAAVGVWYAKNASELIDLYKQAIDPKHAGDGLMFDRSQPMLQEYIHGELYDVPAFCVQGKMQLGLVQKRLLMKPEAGGIGVVNVTAQNEEMLHYTQKIIEHIQWDGILQVEYKIDQRDGKPKLIEANPRFYGTTWLTVCAGFNYPHYLVSRAFNQPVEYPKSYKMGLYGRWLYKEFPTVFEKPATPANILKRLKEFICRFKLKNCAYYLGRPFPLK